MRGHSPAWPVLLWSFKGVMKDALQRHIRTAARQRSEKQHLRQNRSARAVRT